MRPRVRSRHPQDSKFPEDSKSGKPSWARHLGRPLGAEPHPLPSFRWGLPQGQSRWARESSRGGSHGGPLLSPRADPGDAPAPPAHVLLRARGTERDAARQLCVPGPVTAAICAGAPSRTEPDAFASGTRESRSSVLPCWPGMAADTVRYCPDILVCKEKQNCWVSPTISPSISPSRQFGNLRSLQAAPACWPAFGGRHPVSSPACPPGSPSTPSRDEFGGHQPR